MPYVVGGDGQQGNGNKTDVLTFVRRLDNVKKFVIPDPSSMHVTWALLNNGDLYNANCQQGDGNTDEKD